MKTKRLAPIARYISIILLFFSTLFFGVGYLNYSYAANNQLKIIIDDYAGQSMINRGWYYSRIGTDRGEMGDGNYSVTLGGGKAEVNVISGWGGVWTSLLHNMKQPDSLNLNRPLGPYIKDQFQPKINGIEMHVSDGYGRIKLEGKTADNSLVLEKIFNLPGWETTLTYLIPSTNYLKAVNWVVDGTGNAVVDQLCFLYNSPGYSTAESVFLYTYAHLSQCYDPGTGLVRDRARWPVEDFSAVQATGMFALITAVAHNLGYVEEFNARSIIDNIRNKMLALPTFKGLLPHFITNGNITENTEWSSVDTAIALISTILACDAVNIDTSSLENMIVQIDWDDLTDNGTRSISHGYTFSREKIENRWDVFGSETFILAVAYAAATGNVCIMEGFNYPPTWDGSGFNDEMAALFFKMNYTDAWNNDWAAYRKQAVEKQGGYFSGHYYENTGLFGLSASEVPEPWTVDEDKVYGAWGVGGHNGANDGSSVVGYPIIVPHYAAMIASEYPVHFETIFNFLFSKNIFSPLNNVESFGTESNGTLHWNSLKGSWNLSLQALGVGKSLSGQNYLPWCIVGGNHFLKSGLRVVIPAYESMEDAIIALKIVCGLDVCLYAGIDKNNDNRIGIADALYCLQELCELR